MVKSLRWTMVVVAESVLKYRYRAWGIGLLGLEGPRLWRPGSDPVHVRYRTHLIVVAVVLVVAWLAIRWARRARRRGQLLQALVSVGVGIGAVMLTFVLVGVPLVALLVYLLPDYDLEGAVSGDGGFQPVGSISWGLIIGIPISVLLSRTAGLAAFALMERKRRIG